MMNDKGFTLIEVLIAVVLLSIAVMSLGQFMGKYQNATAKATLLSTMTTIAKERLETVRADPRYTTMTSRYDGSDTASSGGYRMVRQTKVVRDQSGSPARDRTTITVRVFPVPAITKDTVKLTAVVARP